MPGLRSLFGVPARWRLFVPATAAAAVAAVAMVGLPAAAAPRVVEPAASQVVEDPEPLTAADAVSAQAIARLQNQPVEVIGERTEVGSVFALPDGRMASSQGAGPVWVREGGDGSAAEDWSPVDLTLEAQADGTVQPIAQGADLTLSGGSVLGPGTEEATTLATLTEPASGVTTEISWGGPLPAPRLEGRRAVYPDVRQGIDLVVEATSTGLEQFFVINERPGSGESLELPLTVASTGGEVATTEDGGLSVVADGAVVASSPTALMWDAETDGGRAFPLTVDRPAEDPALTRLSPMPEWVVSGAETSTPRTSAEGGADTPAAPPGDGSIDTASGLVAVEHDVDQQEPDAALLTLTPQEEFLHDPDTEYPVVVDPQFEFQMGFDTYILKGYEQNREGEGTLNIGTYDGGTHIGRAFITFPTAPLAGKQVLESELGLYNYYAWSCTVARQWDVLAANPANSGTVGWGSQPPLGGVVASSTATACGDWAVTNVTGLAQIWANTGQPDGNIALKAANEGDNYGWKKFYSANNGAGIPTLWTTYNSVPDKPTNTSMSGAPTFKPIVNWIGTATPTLYATITDADVGGLNGHFWVMDANANAEVYRGVVAATAGAAISTTVSPALKEGGIYYWAVKSGDCCLFGQQSDWFWFGIDTVAPLAPNVASTAYPSDAAWHGEPGQAGAFTVSMPSGDGTVSGYRWGLDKAPDPAQQVTTTSGAAAAISVTPPDAGRHVLQVQAVDRAGNVSGISKYVFRVGQAGIVGPEDGAQVVQRARIAVEAMPGLAYVHFQWRRGPDSPATDVKDVPPALLSTSAGQAWSSPWQELPATSGYTTWDVGRALGFEGGPVQIRAQLSSSPSGTTPKDTQWVTLNVDPDADGAATASVGPASVNLLTGDSTMSVTDVEEFGIALVRTTSSRDTDGGYQLQKDALTTAQQEGSDAAGMSSPGSATVTVDTTLHHSGSTSYRVSPVAGSAYSFAAVGGSDVGGMRLGMKPGRSYRVSAWIYVPAATGLLSSSDYALQIGAFTRVGTAPYENTKSSRAALTNAWQRLTLDVTVPAGATEAGVRLYDGFTSPDKVVYFDDVSVTELWSPFGPEWDLGTADASAGTAYTRITRPYDDVASLELTGGADVWFTQGADGAWWPEPGAESLRLTSTSPTTWRLTEIDGTVTDFEKNASSNDFGIRSTAPPAAAGATRHIYDVATVPGVSRLSRIIAPIEPGVDGWPSNAQACTTVVPARGCEVVELDYATTTSATATSPGSYAGRVSLASAWTWNGATMSKTPVASYAYTADGRLAQVSDPRIVAAGASAQVTSYTYDSSGRLASVTAPGDAPFRFAYGPGGTTKTGAGDYIDPAPGRLLQVSRASLVPGTADQWGPDNTTTIVYGVPLTRASGGPYDLDAGTISTWAQEDGPTDATAVFGPLDTPSVTSATATQPGPDGYSAATVSYLNASGLEVNTASPAGAGSPVEGYIDTAEYDGRGNAVRTLDATNRLLALGKLPDATAMLAAWGLETRTPPELAQLLDARNAYSEDGLDLLVSVGPVQRLAVGNDSSDVRSLRPTTANTYDEGKPDGAQYHLVTTTTTFGQDIVPTGTSSGLPLVTGATFDPLVTKNGYTPVDGASALGATSGWKHGQPTSVTVDAGQPSALTSTVVYDDRARAVRSSKPGSSGVDAGTTIAVFYTAGANATDAACGNRPEWAGQPCLTRSAGAVTGHDAARMDSNLPTKRVEGYNQFGSPTVVTDSVGSEKRTSTTTYDAADRVVAVALTGTAGTGAAIATTRTTYDPVTGDVVKNASVDANGAETAAITKEYDKLGRLTKYTDAAGGWTRTTYDRLGQPLTVTDSIGTTRTYTYDRAVEPRGFVTQMVDSVAGTITPTWGPDGQLESQLLPGGVRLTVTYDTARVPTARTYTRVSDGVVIARDSVVENHRGQWITHASDTGVRNYRYDRLGRLTGVDDTSAATDQCTSRTYGYDTHTNRTSFTQATGAVADVCPGTTGATTVTSSYDTADRLVSTSGANGSSWSYDLFGRVTAMPVAGGSVVAANEYFVNDLVAAQEVPGATRSVWGLDPLQRFATQDTSVWVDGAWANSTEQVSHFDGDGDEPAWIVEDATLPDVVSRFVEGMDGAVAVATTGTGGRVLQLVNLHGDVTGTLPIGDGEPVASWSGLQFTSFDEFGNPEPLTSAATGNAPPAARGRYGWLGAAQRSADTPTGTILMGVRLYSPVIGRFLQVDPVPGGSASAYDYCNADPVNCTDLGGTFSWKGLAKVVAVVAEASSMFVPGPIGFAIGAVAVGAYLAADEGDAAKMAAIGAAATLVGAGVAVAAVKAARLVKTAQALGRLATRAAPKMERAASGTFAPWNSTKKLSSIENAMKHFSKHGIEVGARNLRGYVVKANRFLESRLPALTRTRASDGAFVRWNPITNHIGVRSAGGAPQTFFRAATRGEGWKQFRAR
ncbi:DNRLRE domain-containing protein [Cellulomonas soli]|uniref:Intein C-terminal splicing domain-containing protein n=1 Tax=Cellulomonas soli TaxID=931535 RepID=A0A512PCR0_9CELL|nr:DNRLRE domain-containing protein [Cellulomonas soli]NYI58521.1 RHS repeat-associated protein [Cellulomonas soli]GEP68946.1 hypothetical protein CSO01_16610 [Cellulomonas soli]